MDKTTTTRLDSIIYMLSEFSRGNFRIRNVVTEDDDPLNTVISGLNMLGEELDSYRLEIENQRTFLHNILSSIDEVIYVRTINLKNFSLSPYSFISDRSLEIIGVSSDQLRLKPDQWIKIVHPEDQELIDDTISRFSAGQETIVTYRIYHGFKKQYRWIEERISPKLDAEGTISHIYGSARDVTEQYETTLELNRTGQLLTRLITSSDQVFYIVAIDEDDPLRNTFTYLSPHVESVIGYRVEDVRNDPLSWIKAIHPDDVENVKSATREMFKSKSPGTRVYRMKHRRTGEYVWLEDYVVPILDEKGWVREFYASARDITGRKKAEIERERLIDELGRKHEELMQFSHIVSHNLRSPVANILGLAEYLHDITTTGEQCETSGYILQAAQSMDGVLRDLNTVLSVRSSIQEKMTTFSFREVLDAVCVSLRKQIDESGTTVNVHIDPLADRFTSIKSYIQSAVFNLVSNAIKYRAASRAPIINVTVSQNNSRTIISVSDNGEGIDLAAHGERLFMLYSRLNVNRDGKGLGLYMTKTQIEMLNGKIEVESEKGKGTKFIITL
ncbi:PAS domain-containing sensor histidine kinase [Pedobacter sp. JY14-1]|uniref:sensor histidine kinase n=1 Tax=Pedobacter sp. JY14-1 TaxID=3034151 RepID=UPI0023E2A15C|nr:PAS domain-containing sensor histidine kinase [Pedobacter sp. JY14-1]